LGHIIGIAGAVRCDIPHVRVGSVGAMDGSGWFRGVLGVVGKLYLWSHLCSVYSRGKHWGHLWGVLESHIGICGELGRAIDWEGGLTTLKKKPALDDCKT